MSSSFHSLNSLSEYLNPPFATHRLHPQIPHLIALNHHHCPWVTLSYSIQMMKLLCQLELQICGGGFKTPEWQARSLFWTAHFLSLNIDIPNFTGHAHVEEFLNWVSVVDKFFDYIEMVEDKKAKLVTYMLHGGASALRDHLQNEQRMVSKLPITTWGIMKQLMI